MAPMVPTSAPTQSLPHQRDLMISSAPHSPVLGTVAPPVALMKQHLSSEDDDVEVQEQGTFSPHHSSAKECQPPWSHMRLRYYYKQMAQLWCTPPWMYLPMAFPTAHRGELLSNRAAQELGDDTETGTDQETTSPAQFFLLPR